MLNKGDSLLDSLSDSLEKGNSLIDALDEKLNSSANSNISKDEAFITLQDALFNLQYRINGCEIIEGDLIAKDHILNHEYTYKMISDTSTEIKKQYGYGYPYLAPDAELATSISKYNAKEETGYSYYKSIDKQSQKIIMEEISNEINISTFYEGLFGGTYNLERVKDYITKAEKVNGEYSISILQISERESSRTLLYYTVKISNNKITSLTATNIDEILNEYMIQETYDVASIFSLNYEIKYGSDVDLKTLNDAIAEVDAKVEAAELLNEMKANLNNCTNGFEKFQINATSTESSSQIELEDKFVVDYSTSIKKYYLTSTSNEQGASQQITAYKFDSTPSVNAGYHYSQYTTNESSQTPSISETLRHATSADGNLKFGMFPEIDATNIVAYTKDGDTHIITIEASKTDYFDSSRTSYARSTYNITYKIQDSKFTEIQVSMRTDLSDSLSDERDKFGNAYLETPQIMQDVTLSTTFTYDNIDLNFLNNGIANIDERIESGDLEYTESN